MSIFNEGDTIAGIVTEIRQVDGSPDSLVLLVGARTQASIPLSELPDKLEHEGQKAMRHLARKYMNRKLAGTIISMDPLVLSYNSAAKQTIDDISLKVGDVVKAAVTWTTKNEAELEYENMKLTLEAREFGWVSHVDLRNVLNRGKRIKVEVIEITPEGSIKVSRKKYEPNPWPYYIKKYHSKNQYLARVKSLIKAGVVVSLEPGLDILCSPYPFFDVKVNDMVAVEIFDINPDAGKMKGIVTSQAPRT